MPPKSGTGDWRRLVEDDLPAILETIQGTDVEELEISTGDRSIRIRLGGGVEAGPPLLEADPDSAPATPRPPTVTIAADRVGTFYRAAQGETVPLKSEADGVEAGEGIGFIDSLDVWHEIAAPRAGRLLQFLVPDRAEVEYGEELAILELAADARGEVS